MKLIIKAALVIAIAVVLCPVINKAKARYEAEKAKASQKMDEAVKVAEELSTEAEALKQAGEEGKKAIEKKANTRIF